MREYQNEIEVIKRNGIKPIARNNMQQDIQDENKKTQEIDNFI